MDQELGPHGRTEAEVARVLDAAGRAFGDIAGHYDGAASEVSDYQPPTEESAMFAAVVDVNAEGALVRCFAAGAKADQLRRSTHDTREVIVCGTVGSTGIVPETIESAPDLRGRSLGGALSDRVTAGSAHRVDALAGVLRLRRRAGR